jgi:thiol:disulfide interchange protein
MARKSSKSSVASLLNVDFEVVLIIVLIVVAIILVVFLNKKLGREQFLVNRLKEVRDLEHFEQSNDSESRIPTASPTTKVLFFYAKWCGYSTKYLDNHYEDLKSKLMLNNLEDRFVDCDVETDKGKELSNRAGVTGLPSFYTLQDGEYTKMNFSNGIDNDQIIEWLNAN